MVELVEREVGCLVVGSFVLVMILSTAKVTLLLLSPTTMDIFLECGRGIHYLHPEDIYHLG